LTRRLETWAGVDLKGDVITNLSEIDRVKAPHS
jgi:hypothetical protein